MAMAVNMIPQVIASRSGLKTMMDLPIPHSIENSFAEQVNYYKYVGKVYDVVDLNVDYSCSLQDMNSPKLVNAI